MPIYEYKCNQCDKISEILVISSSDSEGLFCNYCGSNDLKKVLSVSSFTFVDNEGGCAGGVCGRTE